MELVTLLESNSKTILREAIEKLTSARLRHYTEVNKKTLSFCLTNLFELTVESIKSNSLLKLSEYIDTISRERYFSGFELHEVQTAFNTLEEAIWDHIVSKVDPEELSEAIGMISKVMGAGKEFLACNYVRLAKADHIPKRDLSVISKGI